MKTCEDNTEKLSRLIDDASRRPGVAEVMSVFHAWNEADRVARNKMQYEAPRHILSTSNASIPIPGCRF